MKINFVKIGGIKYVVEYIKDLRDDDGKLDGRIHHGITAMQIEKDSSDQAKAQAILHEALHSVTLQIGKPELNKDENFIDSMAYSVYQLIHDNPKLVKWIIEQ